MNHNHPAYRAALKIDTVSAEFAKHGVPYAQARIVEIAQIIDAEYQMIPEVFPDEDPVSK